VDRASGDVIAVDAQTRPTWVDEIAPDPAVQAIVDRYQGQLQSILGRQVGTAASAIERGGSPPGADRTVESEMGNFVADAMRAYFPDLEVAFQNAGGLRVDIDAGPITLEELFAVLPFGNTLVRMDLTGAQVLQVLEEGAQSPRGTVQVSGLTWSYDLNAPFGQRVRGATLADGTPIDPSATYGVVTNNFMAGGGDQFATLTQGANAVDTQVDLVDTVVKYLQDHPTVDPQVEGRITRL
jgi:2',3'-cyclic-nucleotide 2'-phosphodiesterase (5'-nucleotidase family)